MFMITNFNHVVVYKGIEKDQALRWDFLMQRMNTELGPTGLSCATFLQYPANFIRKLISSLDVLVDYLAKKLEGEL